MSIAERLITTVESTLAEWNVDIYLRFSKDGIEIDLEKGLPFLPKVFVRERWGNDWRPVVCTIRQRRQFYKLWHKARAAHKARLAADSDAHIERLLGRLNAIELNPPPAQQDRVGVAVLGMLNPGFNHPILQAAMQNENWHGHNNQAAAQQGQQVVI